MNNDGTTPVNVGGSSTSGNGGGVAFNNFKYFSVTKTTEAYNTTYFNYGGIVGLGYPTSQWDKRFSDFLMPTLKTNSYISKYLFSIEMNTKNMTVTLGGFEEEAVRRVANSTKNSTYHMKWAQLQVTAWSYAFSGVFLGEQFTLSNASNIASIDLGYRYI